MDFRGINPLPDKSRQKKEKQKVRHFPPLNSSHGQETSSVIPNAHDNKGKSPASPEAEQRSARAIGEDGEPVPNVLDNKGKSLASPLQEIRAIGEDGKPVPREIKRSSASTRDNPGLRRVMRGLRKLKLWGGETSQGNDGEKRIRFGKYRIGELLGKGGFAHVYLGKHSVSNELAAVKVLKTHMIDQKGKEEFFKEAEILSGLDHPNIVRVLDFGIKGNAPFLAMEYAPKGTLRDAHPRGEPLSPTQAVEYVNQLADALQYLHDRRLMHLDLKPENALLGAEGQVLLSDFGLVQEIYDTTVQPIPEHGVPGTPAYMDPQYMLGGPPRAASDQYALGVMVYEWLSGNLPFQGNAYRIAAQHERKILPLPFCGKIPDILHTIQDVVFCALEKDPKNRFPHIKAFAQAFEQACRGEPLPPPGLINQGWNNDQNNRTEELLKDALTNCEQRFEPDHPKTAEAQKNLADFYREQDRYAEAEHWYKCSFKILGRGQDYAMMAEVLSNLGYVCSWQHRYHEAKHWYKSSLKICEQRFEPDHLKTAEAQKNLADFYRRYRKETKAEDWYKSSLETCEQRFGRDHPKTAEARKNLANFYHFVQRRYDEAEDLYKSSLEIYVQEFGPDHPKTAEVQKELVTLYVRQDKDAEIEHLYEHFVNLCKQRFGSDDLRTAEAQKNLADFYCKQRRYDEAEDWYKSSLEIYVQEFGPHHPMVTVPLKALGNVFRLQGKEAEAEDLYKRSLEICEHAYGRDHPALLDALGNLIGFYHEQDRDAETEPLYKSSLEICMQRFGLDHLETAEAQKNLGNVCRLQGKGAEAEDWYKSSLGIYKKLGYNLSVDEVMRDLGNVCCLQGKEAEAEDWYKSSLEICEHAYERDHPALLGPLDNLINFYHAQHRDAEAERLYKRYLEICEKKPGRDHSKTKVLISRKNLKERYKIKRAERSQRDVPATSSSVSLSKEASSKNVLEEHKEGVEGIIHKKLEEYFNNCLERVVQSLLNEEDKEVVKKQYIDNFEGIRGLPEKVNYVATLEEYTKRIEEET